MKVILLGSILFGTLIVSCSHPDGTSMEEYRALTSPASSLAVPKNLTLTLNQPGTTPVVLHASNIRAGKTFSLSNERELIYPAAYSPALSHNGNPPIPSNPTAFKTENIGLRCDLTASVKGSVILIEGTINHKHFDGFNQMGGELGKPIVDGRHTLTENRIDLPKFTTYSTPVYVAIKPNSSTTFEINARSPKTKVTISLANTP